MTALQSSVTTLLTRELQAFEREVELFPDNESVWRTVPGITNSAANLALHIAGNLQHFVGAVLGGSGYVRQRDLEFSRRSGTREEIIGELRKAAEVVRHVVPDLTPNSLERIYPEPVAGGRSIRTDLFLLHLCAHASFHLGQAGYLRRALTGLNRTSGAVSLQALAE